MDYQLDLHFIKGVMFGIEWSSKDDNEGDCGFWVLDLGIIRLLLSYV